MNPEVNSQELTEYFSQFGRLNDVYIPKPYRYWKWVGHNDTARAH